MQSCDDGDSTRAVLGVRHAKPGIVMGHAVGGGRPTLQQSADNIRQQEFGFRFIAELLSELPHLLVQELKN